jgi:hypothetical protein
MSCQILESLAKPMSSSNPDIAPATGAETRTKEAVTGILSEAADIAFLTRVIAQYRVRIDLQKVGRQEESFAGAKRHSLEVERQLLMPAFLKETGKPA